MNWKSLIYFVIVLKIFLLIEKLKMEEDVFGSVFELFDEFEKDRDLFMFIVFDWINEGEEDKSWIFFIIGGLDGEFFDESENESKDGDLEEDLVIILEGMFNEFGKEYIKENDFNFKLFYDSILIMCLFLNFNDKF